MLLVCGVLLDWMEDHEWQNFLPDNVGVFCFWCGIVGHRISECHVPVNNGVKQKVSAVVDSRCVAEPLRTRWRGGGVLYKQTVVVRT